MAPRRALFNQQDMDDTKYRDPWIPTMECGNVQSYRRGRNVDDDSSIVDNVPNSPAPERDRLFGLMDNFLSPIMSCMEPRLQMCAGAPSECAPFWDPYSSWKPNEVSYESRDAGTSSQRPDFLQPVAPVRRRKPTPNDVVCGKGHNHSYHSGNQNLRELITANQATYASLTKKEKQNMSRQIVGLILLHTDPPGRFLAWDSSSAHFVDVGLDRSIEKTNQLFRDALLTVKERKNDDIGKPQQPTKKCHPVQIPDHLVHVYNKIPMPHDYLQYPELMVAMKRSIVPPPFTIRHPQRIPGPFPVTKPSTAPPAIVSPRQYIPTTYSLPKRGVPSTLQQKGDFSPRLRPSPPQAGILHDLRDRQQAFDPFDGNDDVVLPQVKLDKVDGSPRRIQDWKRRRTVTCNVDPDVGFMFDSNNSLTEAMESRLSLTERIVKSPRNGVTTPFDISADECADGQAALAATAFLRLDDSY